MTSIRGIPALVRKQFKSAHESGDLTFYATRVAILECDGLPFQLRFSPALANKPKSSKDKSADSKPVDPFDNPPKGLYITDIGVGHYLVLNKFPVIPDHFILATKEFKKQTDLLEEEDLAAAYDCLKAYKTEGEELFGFFNSGEHSGASQPHRHIQFLPVGSMRSGIDSGTTWNVLADSLTGSPSPDLPFRYFAAPIPNNATPKHLRDIYLALYEKACKLYGAQWEENSNDSSISYNLGFTDQAFVLCPRTSEGIKIEGNQRELIGPIALNGTILGGTLLVKTEPEWDALQSDKSKLTEVLKSIGISSRPDSHEGRL